VHHRHGGKGKKKKEERDGIRRKGEEKRNQTKVLILYHRPKQSSKKKDGSFLSPPRKRRKKGQRRKKRPLAKGSENRGGRDGARSNPELKNEADEIKDRTQGRRELPPQAAGTSTGPRKGEEQLWGLKVLIRVGREKAPWAAVLRRTSQGGRGKGAEKIKS